MKNSKERQDPEWGTWKPVKLTRRQRHEVYKALKRGVPTGEFAGRIPFPQLERIYTEFSPGIPKPLPAAGVLIGKRGNEWYCENGCGTVMLKKEDNEAFVAGKKGAMYFCPACLEKHEAAKKARQHTPAQLEGAKQLAKELANCGHTKAA